MKLLILVTSNVAQQKTKEHENTNHLCELHLVHALASVPVEEGLAAEHGGELFGDSLEQLLSIRIFSKELSELRQYKDKAGFPTWMAVELPMKVADILRPLGGMSQTAVLMLLGILDILRVKLPKNAPLIKQIPFNTH